jgi:hypothetical protein
MRGTLSVVEDRRPLARSGLLALLATLGIRQPLVSSLRLSLVLLPFRGLALFVRLLFFALFLILFAALVSHCVILSYWWLSFKLSTSIVAVQLCDVQSIHPFSQTPRKPVRRESRRSPAGANPARSIGRSAGSNQSSSASGSVVVAALCYTVQCHVPIESRRRKRSRRGGAAEVYE